MIPVVAMDRSLRHLRVRARDSQTNRLPMLLADYTVTERLRSASPSARMPGFWVEREQLFDIAHGCVAIPGARGVVNEPVEQVSVVLILYPN